VVDASVAIKWVLPEPHSDAAARLLSEGWELLAPDLIWPEVGNILWKRCRRGEVSALDARAILESFRRFPLQVHPSDLLAGAAWDIARSCDRSFYDSLYLALSANCAGPMVTADAKLYNALRQRAAPVDLLWVENIG
jgi:predicted nucleic acid-binding protein